KAAELIKQEEITNMVGVPTMAHDLIQKASPEDLASLIDVSTGGAKRPETQVKDQKEKFERLNASSGYGLTETNAMVAHITLRDYQERPSSAGRAVPPLNQIEAFSEDGKKLPRGNEGEICIKSPLNFRAYLDDEEATKAAFHEGGWFRSGDIGYVDEENYVYILDRSKDLIIRGGENIGCLEVENALLSFPGVDEATVFAVPDERFGEIVGAVVYSESGDIDLQALRDHAAGELAAYKVPERIWTSPQTLPRGGTGKVDKRMTRQVALMHPAHWSAASS
ncbi:MAG: fatty acid--CoA ligase family protein, partial [Pseudomonadota bacterium]